MQPIKRVGPGTEGLRFRVAGNWEKQRQGYFNNVVATLAQPRRYRTQQWVLRSMFEES